MNDYSPAPIPDPFQRPPQMPQTPRDWKNAPSVVRGWAYPLTWLGIIGMAIFIGVSLLGYSDPANAQPAPMIERVIEAAVYSVFLAATVWLNYALKKGIAAAWTVQLIFSILGLCGFPLGTAINVYILSQWSKPEVKAWFGLN
jgi:hypothetical protein